MNFFEFTCECTACVNNYPMPKKLKKFDYTFKLPKFGKFTTNENLLKELNKSFKYMNRNIENHPSYESTATILRIRELIRETCERISFPFQIKNESHQNP